MFFFSIDNLNQIVYSNIGWGLKIFCLAIYFLNLVLLSKQMIVIIDYLFLNY